METVLFIPGLGAPYSEEQYRLDTREIGWATNQFGVRHVAGIVMNHSAKDLDWVRIEFILYSKAGLPVGSTSDCLLKFAPQKSWKFQAPVSQEEAVRLSEPLLSCEYGRVSKLPHPLPPTPSAAGALRTQPPQV